MTKRVKKKQLNNMMVENIAFRICHEIAEHSNAVIPKDGYWYEDFYATDKVISRAFKRAFKKNRSLFTYKEITLLPDEDLKQYIDKVDCWHIVLKN